MTEIRQALEGAKQEVAEMKQEANGLKALLKALRRREATTDLNDYGASRASNTTDYNDHGAREVTTDHDDYGASGASGNDYGASRASDATDYNNHGAREATTDHDDYGASGAGANDHDGGRANPDKKAEEDKRDTGGSGKRQEDGATGRM